MITYLFTDEQFDKLFEPVPFRPRGWRQDEPDALREPTRDEVKDRILRATPELYAHADNQRPTVWEPAQTLIEELRRRCQESGSQKAWAKANGISAAYVNDVIQGRREVSDNFAALLGFERRVVFVGRP